MSGSVVLVTEADAEKIEHFVGLALLFGDNNAKDDSRVKAAQELSEGFETILASPHYATFVESAVPVFLKFLQNGEAYFVAEYHAQQGRKTILELLHRLPCNDLIKPHARNILNIMFKLLEIDNEENVIICLRIIIELHKQFRPPFSPEVQQFLNFVKSVYKDLPGHMDKIFDPKLQTKVRELPDFNTEIALNDIYAVTSFQCDKKAADGSLFTYNVLPRARNSLKVLQELPIIVVLMYQIYKNNVQQEVAEFIPIVMSTITLQPTALQRANPHFNKEVLVEFMGAQVKTLSFLAYIIKLYQDLVVQHSSLLVTGLINLLALCPMEVAYLRRELFIAARHIMATELRFKFVPYMEKLFDEEVLLGRGWTVNETMRPLAYSTLADLVHHVRQHLSLCDLNRAVMFFSCHVHDESLPLSIQTMSCKLLFNLVESIRLKSESEGGNGREILMRMLDVLVYKFKIIAQVHIPFFLEQNKENAANAPPVVVKPEVVEPENAEELFAKQLATEEKPKEESRRFGFPLAPMQNYSFTECRTLVKTVVCAVKTISWGVASCKNLNQETPANTPPQYKQFTAKETEVYLRLIKWGLKAVDIYAINGPTVNAAGQQIFTPQRPINTQGVRSKEEKEVLEHFAGAFTLLNNYSFRELFAVSIDTLVQRIHENNALQVVANNLLANPTTSAVFATILVEYLLLKMPEMGDDVEKSNLYLRLFKLVFGSVSLFSAENEQMLRPHLKDIVNRSMELALNAKDPYNYFLLLRALFRSIGGGSHDLLYQEFLPLLPSLLQGLNSLQSGLHKQHMKDLFVELCLTVPVRLSSLLPYLPMLMDPLVSALNGSTTLISQGLRTLELCVDNLQPEFLYEHIQPVRAELMQALWRTLRNANDSTAVVAFRILGKFGGSNRKMLVEPQKLEYTDKTILGQCLTLPFQDHKSTITLPVDKILEVALQTLRSLNPSLDLFYKKQAWELVKAFIMSSIVIENDRFVPNKIILHGKMSEGEIGPASLAQRPVFTDEKCRSTLTMGIAGIFIAVCVKELKREAYVFMIPFIRHIALIIVSQQTGPFCGKMSNMDPYVFFDAMAQVLAHEERDMKKPVLVGLSILMNCIINIVRSKDRACALPMIEYLTEKMCNLCYERAWYTKMGGCQAINFFLENMSLRWILSHQFTMVKAMYFVLTDLTGEVSAGALDIARENLAKLIRICATCSDDNLHVLKFKSLHEMTLEFVKQLTSPITNIRNQSMRGLELLAEHQSKTVSAVLEPHKDVLIDMVPPKKHLIRHQSIQSQLGLLDGNTFCLSLRPRLFTLDLNVIEHRNFVSELTALCEAEDQALAKLPCYKNVSNLTSVKMAIMRVVARVARLNEAGPLTKEKIVSLFVKGMASGNTDLMNCAFECLQKFMQEHTVEMDMQTNALKPILSALTNMRTVTIPVLTQLSYLYQLFPGLYTDKVWEQLLQILRKCLELALVAHSKAPARTGVHELKLAVAVLSLFPLLPPSNTRFLEPMVKLCLQAEKALLLGKGCPLRQPLMKFILGQPQEYLDLVFAMPYLNMAEWNRFFIYFIQQDDADVLRQCLVVKPAKLIYCLNIKKNPTIPPIPPHVLNNGSNNSSATPPTTPTTGNNSTPTTTASGPPLPPTFSTNEQNDIQYLAVKAMTVLSEFDEDWILGVGPNRGEVVQALRALWESNDYQASCNTHICCLPASSSALIPNPPPETSTPPSNSPAQTPDSANGTSGTPTPTVQPQTVTAAAWSKLQVQTWKEPQMIAKLLLSYYRKNPSDIDMLFKLLLAFCGKSISQFQFLKDFLEKTVTKYSVQWKRTAFFQFVSVFQDRSYPEELKAKIIQYILIPCMAYCFEKGQGDELIGSEPMPDKDSPDNIVSVFLSKVIDPENPNAMPDSVRILLCQLSCLLVEQASAHIHDATNKKQGNKLRRLMTFAWPCLLSKTCVDSSTKYYGHLLLSHIIAKFAIHKRIVLQVFHSLLKASALEAKNVVKQALEIITPALPLRMEDGNTMLIHWTKKILLEEGHSLSQLMHLLQLIVRHWRVYYPVRHMLVAHMVSAIQRLGFTPTSTFEHRKLAVEMAEVVIKWELERIRNEDETSGHAEKKIKMSPSPLINTTKALEKTHTDSVLNFLLRLACQVNEPNPTSGSPGEILSKRCVNLVKTVLKPDVWANCDLKLSWFDKLFATIDSPQVNNPNICTAFELMTFIIGILSKEFVLINMKLLYKGIAACLNCQNSKVIRSVHTFMTKLMSIFPTEFPGSSCPAMQRYDELEPLYVNVSKVVYEGLNNYEKVANTNAQSLLGALMMCKSACANNPCYIDRIITPFMKVLQRLAREHLNPAAADANLATELLILSLDLVKNRVGVMGVEMRKAFIGTVLVGLIEKSTDTKVMQSIIKMLEEWVRNKNPIVINQGPSLREKSILLVKLMQHVEKRFSGDNDLIGLFLELINFIYRDEHLKVGELNAKLEPAFLSGLRCTQPLIRAKFFQVFDGSIRRRLHDRIMYILCSQNWEAMGPHYWIKQCTELLLSTVIDADVDLTPKEAIIPGIGHNMHTAEAHIRETFMKVDPDMKVEPMDYELPFIQQLENDIEALETVDETDEPAVIKVIARMEDAFLREGWCDPSHPVINVKMILLKEKDFGNMISGLRLSTFVQSVIQLIHLDTNLAEKVWSTFFPRTWKIFSEKQQMAIANDVVPFLCSGVHVLQQTCYPSTMNTFVESLCSCVPAVQIKPSVLYYLGKTHNLWHRMTLLLEQMALDNGLIPQLKTKKDLAGDCYDFEPNAPPVTNPSQPSMQQQEILDALSELYSILREDDLWAGMWQRKARYPETNIGIAFEMQGFYEKAQGAYELAMSKAKADFQTSSATMSIFSELKLWEDHWIRCCKELNQWDIVQEYSASKAGSNPMMVLESAWRVPNWLLMKEALTQVEQGCPKDQAWKVNMYRGYVAILCSAEDKDLTKVDRYVEGAQALCIKEWRRLPALISNVHIGVLQAAQMIVELQESTQIHQGLVQIRPGTLHDVKSVVKTWRNRLPCISDDLSHWSDVFTWRQQHYQYIANHFDAQNDQSGNQTMLGVHASAQVNEELALKQKRLGILNCYWRFMGKLTGDQAICHFGKIARKHNLTAVCLESLSKIYTIPSVPIVDCFQKIKQQVKCYIQQAQVLGRNELQEALDIVESTNLKYFSKEMTCEFFALKGLLLSQIGRSEDANKAFSAACQMHDALSKSWGFWGDYLETTFTRDARQIHLGISAVTAFMNSCRHQNEAKARKYIAKVLWLLMYDDEKGTLADAVDKFALGVPPIQWLPWVPQLLTSLVRHDGKMVINLLNQVGRMYPQAVYFPIRTLYLTLKIEQREKTRHAELAAAAAGTPLPNVQSTIMSPETLSAPALQAAATATASQLLNLAQQIHNYQIQLQQLPLQNLTPLQQQQQQQQIQQQMHHQQQQQLLLQQHHQSLKLQIQLVYASQPQQQQPNQVHNFPAPQPKIEPGTEQNTGTQSNQPLQPPNSVQSALQGANVATSSNSPSQQQPPPQPEAQAIKATPSMWRCSRIMHMQRDLHPTVLSSLEGIVDQIIWFRENWYEEVHRQLKIGLAKCNAIAFENRALVMDACITPQLQNYVKKLVSTFGHVFASSTAGATGSTSMAAPSTTAAGLATTTAPTPSTSGTPTIEALLRRATTTQDPSFQHMKVQFSMDFDNSAPGADKLHNLILKLRKWIKILEAKTRMFPKTFLMEDRFRFLQNFSSQIAEIELPGEFLIPKHAHYYVKIARFQPRIEVVQKHNTSSRRIFIRGHNGKIYPYLIVNDSGLSDQRREERVMQMTRMLNHCLSRQKVTAKRNLRFTVPKVVAVSPQMRLVEDNPASLSLLDIFKISCSRRTVEFDGPIIRYYEKIAAIQTRGQQVSHQVLREILRDIQSNIVPRTMMKEWALNTFNGPSDYWVFRKIFGLQLCLWAFAEYAFHLTRLNPEMMYLHKDSGMINISYFKFDIDDGSGELDSNRPVPFRLTPNITEFLTPFGVQGPIVSTMISIARCLVYPNYKMPAILRAILRDEMISWLKKKQEDRDLPPGTRDPGSNTETDSETVINMVTKSVNAIMHRMQTLSTFDGSESKVSCLVAAANSHDNLCRMDPAWHPWL